MFDSHAHLDFKEFDRDREEAIKRFFDNGGEKMINVGCDLVSSTRSVELAKSHKNIFASIGVHPHDAEKLHEAGMEKLEELVSKEKVVAIGEIGLDYFRNLSSKARQREAFEMQLALAKKYKKPVIIHCRDAYVEMLEILKSHRTENINGVMHCFLGSCPIAKELLKIGFYLGFTGAITYAKKPKVVVEKKLPELGLDEPLDFTPSITLGINRGKSSLFDDLEPEIFNVIKNTPLDRILIETDCPYLAPVPHRGERNEPSFVRHVAEKIAEIKGVSFKDIEKATSENAEKLFEV